MERLLATAGPDADPELPAALFHCRLDGQPDHLVPERFFRCQAWEDRAGRRLFLNPGCRITHDGDLPPEARAKETLLEKLALQGTIAWVTESGTGALQPFWLGRSLSSSLAGLVPGDPAPPGLSRESKLILAMAGILVEENHVAQHRREWDSAFEHAAARFRQRGFAPIAGLIHPFHVAALRRYYRRKLRTGELRRGDQQSERRYVAHNEGVARFLHHQLTSVMSAIAAVKVKPSYVYLSAYQEGAVLSKHTDREQCQFSISFCLDFTPEPKRETTWPLQLDCGSGTVRVFQAIGDALFYKGQELPHYRDQLPQGNTSTSIFFHYVPEDFSGSLD